MIRVVAFMQCPNLPTDRPDVWAAYRDKQDLHRRLLRESMSGKRLSLAFGMVFDMIYWDNANPIPGTTEANPDHMDAVIKYHDPHLIISFGKVAEEALIKLDPPIPMFFCHHPNARYKTQNDLNAFATLVRLWMEQKLQQLLDHQEPVKLLNFYR